VQFTDTVLRCVECGSEFTFSASDQEYHASRGFENEPKRCPACRASRKTGRGNASGGNRPMFAVVCADCGRDTEVPFQPTGSRPVYCRDCFAQHAPVRMAR